MKSKILKKLRESSGYVSGQQLCEEFQVSRTAVWKVIGQLKEEGYQIEAVRNKGYRIIEIPDILSREEIESLLHAEWAGQKVYYYQQIDSTNIRAKQLGEEGAPHGTLVVADNQNGGRGRRGRGWISPEQQNIYMSILLRPDFSPEQAPMLTLVMAYSVVQGIMKYAGVKVQIKWPNDVVLNGKKICGILTEMSAEIDYINHVVIGVGINVNMSEILPELVATATSIKRETGRRLKRAELIAAVIERFEENYALFRKAGDLGSMMKGYNDLLVNKDREVKILEPGNEYTGCALGINEKGELLVRRDDETVTAVYAGEVSVRGIYGYV